MALSATEGIACGKYLKFSSLFRDNNKKAPYSR